MLKIKERMSLTQVAEDLADTCNILTTTTYNAFGGKFFVPPNLVEPGDFVYDPSTMMYTFWKGRPHEMRMDRGWSFYIIEVPKEITDSIINPVKWLEPISQEFHRGKKCPPLFVVTLPTNHGFVTSLFKRELPLHWFAVRLWLLPLEVQPVSRIIIDFKRGSSYTICFYRQPEPEKSAHFLKREMLFNHYPKILAHYKKTISPTYQILIVAFDVVYRDRPNAVAKHNWAVVVKGTEPFHTRVPFLTMNYEGPYEGLVLQKQRIEKKLAQKNFYMHVGGPDQKIIVDAQLDSLQLKIRRAAFSDHWCSWHYRLLDLVMVCLPFGLPAYVLLEIVDRLPGYDGWAHSLKIGLIQSVYASAASVYANRAIGKVAVAVDLSGREKNPRLLEEGRVYSLSTLAQNRPIVSENSTKRKASNSTKLRKRRAVVEDVSSTESMPDESISLSDDTSNSVDDDDDNDDDDDD